MKKKRYLLAAVVVALFALACTAAAAEPEVEAPEQSAYLGDVEVMYVPEWDCYVITTETGSTMAACSKGTSSGMTMRFALTIAAETLMYWAKPPPIWTYSS